MNRTGIAIFLAAMLTCLFVGSSALATFPFIDDFNPFPLEPNWNGSSYRDIAVDENNVVTVFQLIGISNSSYGNLLHLFCRRLDSQGGLLTQTQLISDSSRYSLRAWLEVSHNRKGKWVATNQVEWNCPEWPHCDYGLIAWVSDDQGMFADSGLRVGDHVPAPWYNGLSSSGVDSAGNFVIVWKNSKMPSFSIWCQLFWGDKTPRTDTIRVNNGSFPYPTYVTGRPKIAMTPGGDFVVVWEADLPNNPPIFTGERNVFYRLFHADGTPKTDELCAACLDDSAQSRSYERTNVDVAIADNGDFAITYTTSRARVAMKRFHADGTAKGGELILDSLLCRDYIMLNSRVASDSAGNLLVTWHDDKMMTGYGNTCIRRFSSNGEVIGSGIHRINNEASGAFPAHVDLNNQGLSAFYWRSMQLMDLTDIGVYACGDVNNDYSVNISDAIYLISYIFSGGQGPSDMNLGDVNDDGAVNISDAVALIVYIFQGGSITGTCLGE